MYVREQHESVNFNGEMNKLSITQKQQSVFADPANLIYAETLGQLITLDIIYLFLQ